MTRYTFEEITHRVTKSVPCRACGKKLSRSTTLSQTLSPFNRVGHGFPKTEQQIRAELKVEAEAWHPRNDIHRGCFDAEAAAKAAS